MWDKSTWLHAIVGALLSSTVPRALAMTDTYCQYGDLDLQTFRDPPAQYRPRFRYWIPDASVNLSRVQTDIRDAGRVGAGGVELLGYYNYGDIELYEGVISTDWTKYGWGTDAWRKLQDAAIDATQQSRLQIDLAIGPNQGAGVPNPEDSDGLQWDLQPFNVTVPVGGTFEDTLPGWGTGPLVSASTGLVVRNVTTGGTTIITLATSSLEDVTSTVSTEGTLSVRFPANATGAYYVVFAYYLIHSHYREQQSPALVVPGEGIQESSVTNFVQNGSWVVDHFSAQGAQVVADFWSHYLLNGSHTSKMLRKVGNFLWEDSQEYSAIIYWTPNLPSTFSGQHGYSINRYIPILLHGNSGLLAFGAETAEIYVTDDPDGGASYVSDYRQTLTQLNGEYLQGLTKFANSLGMQSSAQVGYNLPVDMLANIPKVDAPECETLAFSNSIDSYLQYSGPAGLAGRQIVSSECGADPGAVYQQFLPNLVREVDRSLVGGINSFVFHGLPYSGPYPNTSWPSFTTFNYEFSEMHGPRQPAWDYYKGSFLDYTARMQYVLQSGIPKVDLALWLKRTSFPSIPPQYGAEELEGGGYTYEYISPDDFSLAGAIVANTTLAPDRQAFKAMVIPGDAILTLQGINTLHSWAQGGLPVFFLGAVPSNFSGTLSPSDSSTLSATLQLLQSLENVHTVSDGSLATALKSVGIVPRTIISASDSSWYTRWVETCFETRVIVYRELNGSESTQQLLGINVTFATTGKPHVLDPWAGSQDPMIQFSQTANSTTIPLNLADNQTIVIVFKRHGKSSLAHVELNETVLDTHVQTRQHKRTTFVAAPQGITGLEVLRSDGRTIILPPNNFSALPLTNWSLTIESWTPPHDSSDVDGTIKSNSTFKITSLLPWSQLDLPVNLTFVSGRGFYNTSFQWPPASQAGEQPLSGATIIMSPIIHTASLYVNGERAPPLDPASPQADISKQLRKGNNNIEIIVSTPLGNAMLPVLDHIQTYGSPIAPNGVTQKDYGLVGNITVRPYRGLRAPP